MERQPIDVTAMKLYRMYAVDNRGKYIEIPSSVVPERLQVIRCSEDPNISATYGDLRQRVARDVGKVYTGLRCYWLEERRGAMDEGMVTVTIDIDPETYESVSQVVIGQRERYPDFSSFFNEAANEFLALSRRI